MQKEIKDDYRKLKEAYKEVFVDSPNGDIVLMDLLNELGFFAIDPSSIRPELVAIANKILMRCGVYNTGAGLQRYINCIRNSAQEEN